MSKRHCNNCYFGEMCPSEQICEDYISLDEQSDIEIIDNLIEQIRAEFRREWQKYITKWDT